MANSRLLSQLLLCSALCLFTTAVNSHKHAYTLDTGEMFDFEDAIGQQVVISYWAIWCSPCREEIAILNTIHRERDKHNVIVLGVNFDGEQGEKLAEQKQAFAAEYPDLLEDPGRRWVEGKPSFIPRTLIIGTDGELRHAISGKTTRKHILQKLSSS